MNVVAARKKTTRKPAVRRGKAKPAGSYGLYGWIAAGALAVGWLASDGRPAAFLQAALSSPPGRSSVSTATDARPLRTPSVSHGWTRPEPIETASIAPRERTRMPAAQPRPTLSEDRTVRVAAIAPSPRPLPSRLPPMRVPEPPALRPVETVAATAAPSGGERHATRRLDVHADPSESGKRLATIDSGTLVFVVKADGRWRYVKSESSKAEGWVDGGYLAGEQAAETAQATPMRTDPAPMARPFQGQDRPAEPRGLQNLAPIPPLAITRGGR